MKWIHPSASYSLSLAAVAILFGVAGCRNQSGGMANPFLAPDRVPPPATRAIMPGQAQPYYPGDPLPVMQSSNAPSIDGNGLAWSAPRSNAPVAASAAAPEPTVAAEAMVAIPTDSNPLRFPLPATAEPEPMPAAPPILAAADAQNQAVLQASYSEPTLNEPQPVPASPWRTPQVAPPPLPPPPVAQQIIAQPMNPVPLAAMPGTMDVRLRAVASPPMMPLESSTPRIRLPGEVVPQSASNDGFRPRSSMR